MLTATPGAGSSFQGWSGDASGNNNPLGLTMTSTKNITATFYQHIYTWIATGSAVFGTASNWSPPRSAPSTDDILRFNGGGTVTATGVTAQTIGQLVVSNATTVALQVPTITTLTIAGGAGPDLDVQAGSTLRLNGAGALSIALGASATGSVSGTVEMPNAAQ